MVSMEEQGPDGTPTHHADRTAMLVYTADGHVSVQVMYPEPGPRNRPAILIPKAGMRPPSAAMTSMNGRISLLTMFKGRTCGR